MSCGHGPNLFNVINEGDLRVIHIYRFFLLCYFIDVFGHLPRFEDSPSGRHGQCGILHLNPGEHE